MRDIIRTWDKIEDERVLETTRIAHHLGDRVVDLHYTMLFDLLKDIISKARK